jgi:hypothetical protein
MAEDYELDMNDPTLSQCCVRDLEDRKRAAAFKAELRRNDPILKAEMRAKVGAGIMFGNSQQHAQHNHTHASNPAFPTGKLIETDECNVISAASSGGFVVCLALPPSSTPFETALRNWIDGFDCILMAHRFRPSTCKSCFLNEDISLPALIVWSKGARLLAMDRPKLESENEATLIGRLTVMKRQFSSSDDNESDNEDDDNTTTGRNNFFKCEKHGCSRTFHHVHVKEVWKNSGFENGRNEDKDDEMEDEEDL